MLLLWAVAEKTYSLRQQTTSQNTCFSAPQESPIAASRTNSSLKNALNQKERSAGRLQPPDRDLLMPATEPCCLTTTTVAALISRHHSAAHPEPKRALHPPFRPPGAPDPALKPNPPGHSLGVPPPVESRGGPLPANAAQADQQA